MGGDDSQKLLPQRGILLPSGAQTSGSLRNQHCNVTNVTENCGQPGRFVAQLQPVWVIFGKHRWVNSGARRRARAIARTRSLMERLPSRNWFLLYQPRFRSSS